MFTPYILGFGIPNVTEWGLAALVGIGFFAVIPVFFMGLWNSTMPEVFNLRPITFWQSVRLLVIAAFLCGGLANCNRYQKDKGDIYIGQPPYERVSKPK